MILAYLTNPLRPSKSIEDLTETPNGELKYLKEWLQRNILSVNVLPGNVKT